MGATCYGWTWVWIDEPSFNAQFDAGSTICHKMLNGFLNWGIATSQIGMISCHIHDTPWCFINHCSTLTGMPRLPSWYDFNVLTPAFCLNAWEISMPGFQFKFFGQQTLSDEDCINIGCYGSLFLAGRRRYKRSGRSLRYFFSQLISQAWLGANLLFRFQITIKLSVLMQIIKPVFQSSNIAASSKWLSIHCWTGGASPGRKKHWCIGF